MADIKVNIRQNSGSQFEVTIKSNVTVKELKEACAGQAGIPADEQRLIFKGKILKDETTLDEYKIEDGSTLHLVKGKSAASGSTGESTQSTSTTQSTGASNANVGAGAGAGVGAGLGGMGGFGGLGGFGGMGGFPNMAAGGGLSGMGGLGGMNPAMMQQMMNNPMVQQMLSDPAFMQQMIDSNPMLSQMVNANPQMRAMLSNPELIRSMMTPENLNAAMSMMGGMGGMGGLGGMGGMGALGGQPGSFQMPGGAGGAGAAGSTGAQQQQQQPNPYAFGGMGMNPLLMQQMMGGFGAPQSQPADTRPAREKYATQLQQIKEMGFLDEEVVLQMLEKTNGNVALALENLFSQLGGN